MMEQDSSVIISTAQEIKSDADVFKNMVDAFYDLINDNIKAAEGGSWNGPRAASFLANANAKRATFDSAKANLVSLANNLEEQGNAWAGFEGGGA